MSRKIDTYRVGTHIEKHLLDKPQLTFFMHLLFLGFKVMNHSRIR